MKNQLDPGKTLEDLLHAVLNLALVEVGAPAGSLMMLDRQKRELHIRARLGPPRKRRTDEPIFMIKGKGIASKVAGEGQPHISPNVETDKCFRKTRKGASAFKSLLCVPIMVKEEVFGVINADHEGKNHFTTDDLTRLKTFADHVAPVIAERISVPEALRKITVELTRETQVGDIENLLRLIADNIRNALGADVIILYQYDHESKQFVRTGEGGPTVSGDLMHPEFMKNPVYQTDVPYQILKNEQPVYVAEVSGHADDPLDLASKIIRKGEEHPNRERFCKREGVRSLAALPLIYRKPNDHNDFVGVLFVNYRRKHVFNIDEEDALEAFGEAAALAILNARREDRNRKEKTGLYYRIEREAHSLLTQQDFLHHFRGVASDAFVMAIDIRRSTDLMLNATSAESYVDFMCALEKRLKDAVLRNHGIVDKFTGDGLIAHFPPFYAGEDAGILCLRAATECHQEFSRVYADKRGCFRVVLSNIGLGIGIDFGTVHFTVTGQELIAVGTPVVYACRLASVDGGCTVMNEQAARHVLEKYPELHISNRPMKVSLKHQGECCATQVTPIAVRLTARDPSWLSKCG